MKNKLVITTSLRDKEELLEKLENKYSNLDQITTFDNIGREMNKRILMLRGEVKSLKWVLNSL